jgi:hypothetical protein
MSGNSLSAGWEIVTSPVSELIAILVLALVRLVVRFISGAPPLPADLPEPMKLAAHLSHVGLYALMIGMPLIGWAMLSAADYPIVLYGGIRLREIVSGVVLSQHLRLARDFESRAKPKTVSTEAAYRHKCRSVLRN